MSPRDFLEDNQQPMTGSSTGRDFLPENEASQEGLGTSAALAIPRILKDLGTGAYNIAKQVPSYYEKAKTEVPGLLNPTGQMYRHPLHAAGQAFAGANELINSLAQAPLNLSRYASDRLNLLPQGVTNAIQKITPEDTTQAINQLFGQPQYPGEAALRGGIRNADLLYGGSKLAGAVKPSTLFTTKKGIKNSLLGPHDVLENQATKAFNDVSKGVNERGITQVPVDENSIKNLKQYFSNTRADTDLINQAATGDYNALRKLQTDLYKKGKKNLGSDLEADRLRGSEMLEKRNDINQGIYDHLVNTGNTDLANTLQGARNDWSTLQKIYYNENMNNALVNMFDKNYRKIPKNLVDILGEESIPMRNLLDFHPGLEAKVKGHIKGQNLLGKGLKYGIPLGTAFLGYEYGKPKGR